MRVKGGDELLQAQAALIFCEHPGAVTVFFGGVIDLWWFQQVCCDFNKNIYLQLYFCLQ